MRIAVYGIGNTLLGDDGVGTAVASYLVSHSSLPPDVVVEDLGTPSLDLPNYLSGFDSVIFIDAVASPLPPGSVVRFPRAAIPSTPPSLHLSPHELSITDALAVLEFAGTAPRDVVLIGVVPATLDGVALSPPVASAIPQAAQAVVEEIVRAGGWADLRVRPTLEAHVARGHQT